MTFYMKINKDKAGGFSLVADILTCWKGQFDSVLIQALLFINSNYYSSHVFCPYETFKSLTNQKWELNCASGEQSESAV